MNTLSDVASITIDRADFYFDLVEKVFTLEPVDSYIKLSFKGSIAVNTRRFTLNILDQRSSIGCYESINSEDDILNIEL